MPENNEQLKEPIPEAGKDRSRGLEPLPAGTFEHDVAVSGKYQKVAAELLRLSLAGIGAVGFLIVTCLSQPDLRSAVKEFWTGWGLILGLGCFGLCAAAALLHLYVSADSEAYHLEYLRFETSLGKKRIDEIRKNKKKSSGLRLYVWPPKYNGAEKDLKEAADEKDTRNFLLKISGKLLFVSGALLWLGAALLVASFIKIIPK